MIELFASVTFIGFFLLFLKVITRNPVVGSHPVKWEYEERKFAKVREDKKNYAVYLITVIKRTDFFSGRSEWITKPDASTRIVKSSEFKEMVARGDIYKGKYEFDRRAEVLL